MQNIPRAVCFETRVDCAVSHGVCKSGGKGTIQTSPAHLAWSQPFVGTQSAQVEHPGVESVSRAPYISTPSKPVFSSSGIEVTSEHAVISGFSAESSVPVQGTSCVDRAVSHGFDGTVSGGSCGKDTSLAHLARSRPGVSTQCAHVGYPGVELVSRATYISRKKRNLETVQRQSKALKKSSTGCETQIHCTIGESAMKPLEQTKNFLVLYTSATISPCYMDTRTCFSVHSVVPSTLVEL